MTAMILAAALAIQQEKFRLDFEYQYDFYHTDVLDDDNISNLFLLASDAVKKPLAFSLEEACLSDEKRRGGTFLSAFLIGLFWDLPLVAASHEYGHFRAYSRAGVDKFIFISAFDDLTYPVRGPEHVFSNMFNQIWNNESWYVGVDDNEWNNIFVDRPAFHEHFYEFLAVIEAGGVNQEQHTLEIMADRIVSGRAHISDGPAWFFNIQHPIKYPIYGVENSDLYDYLEHLKEFGVRSTPDRIKDTMRFRYLGASSTAMWAGLYRFLADGDHTVNPPLRYWPEFASYLTTKGVTVKTRNWIALSDCATLEPIVQWSRDTSCKEIGWRISGVSDTGIKSNCSGFLNQTKGNWWEGSLSLAVFPWLDLGLGASLGHGYTFEREISGKTYWFYEKNEFSLKGLVGMHLSF